MNYEVKADLIYMDANSDQFTLNAGDIVKGIDPRAAPEADKPWMRRAYSAEKKQRLRGKPPERILFFKAYGQIRYAKANSQLSNTQKSVTVPED